MTTVGDDTSQHHGICEPNSWCRHSILSCRSGNSPIHQEMLSESERGTGGCVSYNAQKGQAKWRKDFNLNINKRSVVVFHQCQGGASYYSGIFTGGGFNKEVGDVSFARAPDQCKPQDAYHFLRQVQADRRENHVCVRN